MNNVLLKEENSIYRTQFASIACISAFTFKVVMLPSYFALTASNLAFVSIAIMMLIDTILYGIVFYISKHINVLKIENKALIAPIMAGVFFISLSRIVVLSGETVAYTSSTLFDQGKITFILITLFPVLAYICLKGATAMGRMAQIVFAIAVLAIGATLLLLRAEMDFSALRPFDIGYNNVFKACDMHYFWFGDYIPLLFMRVVPPKRSKEKKFIIPLALTLIFTGIVCFYVLFTVIYADAGQYIAFAFNKIAVFNKVTQLIGPTNFPVIIAWILMAIVKLSILFYTVVMSLTYFIKSKKWSIVIIGFAVGLIVGFVMPNLDSGYVFATSWIRYVVAVVQYAVPIILLVYVLVNKKKIDQQNLSASVNEPPEYSCDTIDQPVADANSSAPDQPNKEDNARTLTESDIPKAPHNNAITAETSTMPIQNINKYSPNMSKISIKQRAARFAAAYSKRKGSGYDK